MGLEGQFLQFVPETLEHPSLHFSDDHIAPLIPKIGNKIEKTVLLKLNFTPVPPILASPSPKLWVEFVILLYLPIRLGVNLN